MSARLQMRAPTPATAEAVGAARPTPTPRPRWRPHYHFTPARHWMNDPNGLVWFDGEYHLFFQYNPEGDQWGHMSWGHAVSTDLLTWRELAVAIPEDDQAAIFSGSIVVDAGNTSGFGRSAQGPLVAIYTAAIHGGDQVQHLAYSLDRGRSWTKHAGNPVLSRGMKDFRDPKVFWHAATGRWVMLVSLAHECRAAFYGSPDLKAWTLLSEFGPAGVETGLWECPDLIPLPVEDEAAGDDGHSPTGETLWALKVDVFDGHPSGGSGAQVFLGRFDGASFTPLDGEPPRIPDFGSDFYAAIAWANLPAEPARQVWLGWMSCHRYAKRLPTAPWRGAMSVPRELRLQRGPRGLRLLQRPVAELATLRTLPHQRLADQVLVDGLRQLQPVQGPAFELNVVIAAGSAADCGVAVHAGAPDGPLASQATRIGIDRARACVYLDRSRSGFLPADDPGYAGRREAPLAAVAQGLPIALRVLVDASSIEVFVDDGEVVLTELVLPDPAGNGIALFARGGSARFSAFETWGIETVAGERG